MAIVLDNSTGERVLLYGWTGSDPVKLLATTAGLQRQSRHFTQVLSQIYTASVAAHVLTTRWSYTVPAGRIAFVEGVHLRIDPTTAAFDAQAIILLTRSGGANATLAQVVSLAADVRIFDHGYDLALAAGDVLAGYTLSADAVARQFDVSAFLREVTL